MGLLLFVMAFDEFDHAIRSRLTIAQRVGSDDAWNTSLTPV
ncbi:hypothetical protein [Burkholderia sp. Ac-20353]|nr:hypothetical protein [Burkholderia sp. Ac-20353]